VGGRERRTYKLTRAGRHALAAQRGDWKEFRDVVNRVLGGEPWPATG
jgi:DNA-binding PadR family transcriptional regulator